MQINHLDLVNTISVNKTSNPSKNQNIQAFNFKGHYIVRVPHCAFPTPENFNECQCLFFKKLLEYTGRKYGNKLKSSLSIFFPKLFGGTTIMIPENMSYGMARPILDKLGYSLSWLSNNMNLPIQDVANEGYHTYHLYTKGERIKVLSAIRTAMKKLFKYSREVKEKYSFDLNRRHAYAKIKMGINADENIAEALKGVPVKDFQIKSLEDLKEIVAQMD